MPNSLLAADTLFPKIDENKTQNENLRTVTNYLYMLVEELRYTFNNLDANNFNEAGLEEIANIITEPVYVQLADDEGNISALLVQVDSLYSRLQDAEGNVSTLQQTATALESRVQSAEGSISVLNQSAEAISARVGTAEGNISAMSLTVGGLATRVQSAEGSISTLTQTAGALQASISGVDGRVSTLAYTVDGITITDQGQTLLNGTMLKTGTVMADYLRGQQIDVYGANGYTVYGSLYAGTNRVGTTAFEVYGTNGLRLTSAQYENVFIQAGGTGGPFITLSPNSSDYAHDEGLTLGGAPLFISSDSYGTSLPQTGYERAGQLFFLRS